MALKNKSITVTYRAFDTSASNYKTDDAGNHTLRVVKDGVSAVPTNVPAQQVDAINAPGLYKLTLTAAEMNGDFITLSGKSSTASVILVDLPSLSTEGGYIAGIGSGATVVNANVQKYNSETITGTYANDIQSAYTAANAAYSTAGAAEGAANEALDTVTNIDARLTDAWAAKLADIETKIGYLPSVKAGDAGGLFIAGTNAATSIADSLTTTFTGNLTGTVGKSAMTLSASDVTGNLPVDLQTIKTVGVTCADPVTIYTKVGSHLEGSSQVPGANTVTVAVVDEDNAPLQNAVVRFSEGVNVFSGRTDAYGNVYFCLDNRAYAVSVTKDGYTFAPVTSVVTGGSVTSLTMTRIATPPSDPATSRVWTYTRDIAGNLEPDVTVYLRLVRPNLIGLYRHGMQILQSDSTGLVQTNMPARAQCAIRRADGPPGRWITFDTNADGIDTEVPPL